MFCRNSSFLGKLRIPEIPGKLSVLGILRISESFQNSRKFPELYTFVLFRVPKLYTFSSSHRLGVPKTGKPSCMAACYCLLCVKTVKTAVSVSSEGSECGWLSVPTTSWIWQGHYVGVESHTSQTLRNISFSRFVSFTGIPESRRSSGWAFQQNSRFWLFLVVWLDTFSPKVCARRDLTTFTTLNNHTEGNPRRNVPFSRGRVYKLADMSPRTCTDGVTSAVYSELRCVNGCTYKGMYREGGTLGWVPTRVPPSYHCFTSEWPCFTSGMALFHLRNGPVSPQERPCFTSGTGWISGTVWIWHESQELSESGMNLRNL